MTMKNTEFVKKLVDIANNYDTLYVMGCFGAPLNGANKARYTKNHSYNKQSARTRMINAASADTFGFDCVCLIKGVLWGWNGNKSKTYGGAGYAINGVPDIGADQMITKCSGISTNFSKIEVGEAVWMPGHIGVYIGDGLAVECTPSWKNCVQLTACNCSKAGYPRRNWTKHGKLPYIDYSATANTAPAVPASVSKLVTKGVINSPDYWAEHINDVDSLDGLLKVLADGVGNKVVANVTNINEAVQRIYKAGVINSPDYWLANYRKVKYLDTLIINAANRTVLADSGNKTIGKGSKVKVHSGAKTYTGGGLAPFVYKTTYTVLEPPKGDRAVIGINGAVTAAVRVSDLILVG